jgi:hypothetical protein
MNALNFNRLRTRFASVAIGAAVLLAGSPAVAADVMAAPDGQVAIHYWRADGDYKNWGVHLWESFEAVKAGKVVGPKDKSDMPIMAISWSNPMPPTGTDGFGVYWLVKQNEFRNGKINYIIHKGDSKEQCAKDIAWFVETQGREVFVNSGDCNTYYSADEAMKARK